MDDTHKHTLTNVYSTHTQYTQYTHTITYLVLLKQFLNGRPQVAEVRVHVAAKEEVLGGGEDHLRHVLIPRLRPRHVHAVVVDPNQLVHHRLVCPLREERRDLRRQFTEHTTREKRKRKSVHTLSGFEKRTDGIVGIAFPPSNQRN